MSEAVDGKDVLGRGRGADDQADFGGQNIGFLQRLAGRGITHREGRFLGSGDAPLANTGARHDPFVGRLDHLGQIVVGHHFRRNIFAPADDMCVSHAAPCKSKGRGDLVLAAPHP